MYSFGAVLFQNRVMWDFLREITECAVQDNLKTNEQKTAPKKKRGREDPRQNAKKRIDNKINFFESVSIKYRHYFDLSKTKYKGHVEK